ncbi:hypothetical protein A4X13_0g9055, partial [Tilletia indica]
MNEGDYKVLTPSEEVEKWEERLRHPECPPEEGHPYYRFEVTDGHRYKRTIFKKGTDMLWPVATAPRLLRHVQALEPRSARLVSPRMSIGPLQGGRQDVSTERGPDLYRPVHGLHVLWRAQGSPVLPQPGGHQRRKLRDGRRTTHPGGCVELSMLRLNFERFWPLLPSIHIKCRARDDSTVEELALIIATLTRVPVRSLRITRAYGELGQYREKDNIDLDVHPDLDGMTRVLIRHPQYSIQVHMANTFPLRHVLDFLHEQFGQKIALLHEQKIVDPNDPLHQLTKSDGQEEEETFIRLEARTIQRTFEVLKDVVIPDLVHIMVLPVHVDGTATTRPCVMPFGTTLSQWWHIYQGTDMMRDPAFYLDGAPVRGDAAIYNLIANKESTLAVVQIPKHPLVQRASRGQRYERSEYEGNEKVRHPGYIAITFTLHQTSFVAHVVPTTPFRVLLDFLYQELGLSLALHYQGTMLSGSETARSRGMTGTVKVRATRVCINEADEYDLRQQVVAMVTHFHAAEHNGTPWGMMVPVKTTLQKAWSKGFHSLGIMDPRFVIDGERIPNNYRFSGLELEDDSYFD